MTADELSGADLDLAVAKALGLSAAIESFMTNPPKGSVCWLVKDGRPDFWEPWAPSTNDAQGGPIIDKYLICTSFGANQEAFPGWSALMGPEGHNADATAYGPTRLIAAMRAFVASKEPA